MCRGKPSYKYRKMDEALAVLKRRMVRLCCIAQDPDEDAEECAGLAEEAMMTAIEEMGGYDTIILYETICRHADLEGARD